MACVGDYDFARVGTFGRERVGDVRLIIYDENSLTLIRHDDLDPGPVVRLSYDSAQIQKVIWRKSQQVEGSGGAAWAIDPLHAAFMLDACWIAKSCQDH